MNSTMTQEGAPSMWHLAMRCLETDVTNRPPVHIPLFECKMCGRDLPIESYRLRTDGKRLTAECLDCLPVKAEPKKRVKFVHPNNKGRTMSPNSLRQICAAAGVAQSTIARRLKRGMSLEDAISKAVRGYGVQR